MPKYNYIEVVKDDIKVWGGDNPITVAELKREDIDISDIREQVENDDAVTGNLSGSYFCNAHKAQEAIDTSGIFPLSSC